MFDKLLEFLAAQDNVSLLSEVAAVTYIFAPTFDFGPNSIPNLSVSFYFICISKCYIWIIYFDSGKIPIYAIHHSFAALRAMTSSSTQDSYANNLHPRLASLLLSLIELSLSLFVSHLIFFLHKLDINTYPDSVQQLHGSGTEMVYQITNYLVDLAAQDTLVIKHLNSYLASLLRVQI